jgi:hypothetical protein
MVHRVPTAEVAVNSPPDVMVPQPALQFTGILAVNCWVCPCGVLTLTGDRMMGDTILAVVDPVAPLPPVAVAVMVHGPGT